MTSPRPRGGRRTYWKWSCPTGCHPVGLERWKLCVPVILKSKGSVAKPCFWYLFLFLYLTLFVLCPWIFTWKMPSSRRFQLKRYTHKRLTWPFALHAFCRGHCIASHCLRLSDSVSCGACPPKKHGCFANVTAFHCYIFFFPSRKALVFLKWREQFSTYCCRIEIDEKLAHVFKGLWEHLEKVKNRRASKTKVPPSPAF